MEEGSRKNEKEAQQDEQQRDIEKEYARTGIENAKGRLQKRVCRRRKVAQVAAQAVQAVVRQAVEHGSACAVYRDES